VNGVIVTDEEQFIDRLADGDILLFDKLGAVHRLVQWADNRPVGHCAIWSGGNMYEATMMVVDGEKQSGVFATSLPELLQRVVRDDRGTEVALVRTVTAMRHREITADARQRMAEYAAECAGSGAFAERELVLLAPYALRRSYGHDSDQLGEFLASVIRLCKFMAPKTKPKPDEPSRMFCSEFVYRTYQAADLPIVIVDSLYDSYMSSQRTSSRQRRLPGDLDDGHRPRGRFGPAQVPPQEPQPGDALMAQYDAWFETQVVGTPVSTYRKPASAEPADVDVTLEGGLVEWVLQRRAPEFYEMVTPGDYWTSASLETVVTLYRPPDR